MHVHLASAVNNWIEPEQAPHKRAYVAHMCVDISLIPRPEKEEEKEPGNKASFYIVSFPGFRRWQYVLQTMESWTGPEERG